MLAVSSIAGIKQIPLHSLSLLSHSKPTTPLENLLRPFPRIKLMCCQTVSLFTTLVFYCVLQQGLLVVIVNFMKFSWRENFIYRLELFDSFTVGNFSKL